MPLRIVRNDITKMNTEAVVNTANAECIVGAGCDTAIYNAAGYDRLLAYRKEHVGEKSEGEAFITPGFDLSAGYIIHVVSPYFTDGNDNEEEKLRSCYRNAFKLAEENKIGSISFPLISTGCFGYPRAEALRIAMDECNAYLLGHDMDINIVVFDSASTEMAEKLYPRLENYISRNYVSEKVEEEYETDRIPRRLAAGPSHRGAKGAAGRGAKGAAGKNSVFMGAFASGKAAKTNACFDEAVESEDLGCESVYPECESLYPECESLYPECESEELEDSSALAERLSHLKDAFGEYFFYLVESKGLSSSEVQNGAWITKQVYSKIKTNKVGYKPSKRVAMQLCIGLKLSIDESIDLLARAGFAFSPADKQDLIFRFFIENKCYDIIGISDALQEYGMEPIIDF